MWITCLRVEMSKDGSDFAPQCWNGGVQIIFQLKSLIKTQTKATTVWDSTIPTGMLQVVFLTAFDKAQLWALRYTAGEPPTYTEVEMWPAVMWPTAHCGERTNKRGRETQTERERERPNLSPQPVISAGMTWIMNPRQSSLGTQKTGRHKEGLVSDADPRTIPTIIKITCWLVWKRLITEAPMMNTHRRPPAAQLKCRRFQKRED